MGGIFGGVFFSRLFSKFFEGVVLRRGGVCDGVIFGRVEEFGLGGYKINTH